MAGLTSDSICKCRRMYTEYRESDLISNIDLAIDVGLRDHLLFVISDETARFIEQFLELNGVEFIDNPLENGHISITPLGVAYLNQIHEELRREARRLDPAAFQPVACEVNSDEHSCDNYSHIFAFKFQKGFKINEDYGWWEKQGQFMLSENEEGIKQGLVINCEAVVQCGEIFAVNSWAADWWDVRYKGVGCAVQSVK